MEYLCPHAADGNSLDLVGVYRDQLCYHENHSECLFVCASHEKSLWRVELSHEDQLCVDLPLQGRQASSQQE
jgi:hypothetical protein